MDPEEMVRLWDATRELCRDTERDAGLRRRALRLFFSAMVGPDEELESRLASLQAVVEQLRS